MVLPEIKSHTWSWVESNRASDGLRKRFRVWCGNA
ncbi:hypothetical protein OROGR_006675 [Orobanche gracilis]